MHAPFFSKLAVQALPDSLRRLPSSGKWGRQHLPRFSTAEEGEKAPANPFPISPLFSLNLFATACSVDTHPCIFWEQIDLELAQGDFCRIIDPCLHGKIFAVLVY